MNSKSYKVADKLNDTICSKEKPSGRCSCDSLLKKPKFYTCPCGHIFCEICQCDELQRHRKNGMSTRDKNDRTKCKNTKNGISKKCSGVNCNINQFNVAECKKAKGNEETFIKYRNQNYNESKSSGISSFGSKISEDKLLVTPKDVEQDNNMIPRPVICPVAACGKMIALDSVLLHFYFDHSKIPRITWSYKTLQHILLKTKNISESTSCFFIFLLEDNKRLNELLLQKINLDATCTSNHGNSGPLLLLMGAKLRNTHTEGNTEEQSNNISKCGLIESKHRNTNISSKRSDSNRKVTFSLKEKKDDTMEQEFKLKNNDDLILWICCLNMDKVIYSLTLIKEDKKLGHSYIGEAIDIRDNQDAKVMRRAANCLIVRGVAANRLINNDNQINLIVNILE